MIMAHPDWIGNPPEDPYWSDDGRSVYYLRKRNGEEQQDLIRVDLESGVQTLVTLGDRGKADAPDGDLSTDRRWKTYARHGDVFLKDLESGTVRQITRTEAEEADPRFLVGDSRIYVQTGRHGASLRSGRGDFSQPADLQLQKDPAEDEESGYLDEQQGASLRSDREAKDKEAAAREEERAARHVDPTRTPPAWFLGEDIAIVDASLSPSGDWMVLVTQAKDQPKKPSVMARFVTEDGYVKADEVRAKVGTEPLADQKLLLLDLISHEKHEVDLSKLPGIMEDPLKELREKAEKKKKDSKDKKDGKEEKDKKEKQDEKKPRPVEVWGLAWSDDGHYAGLMLRASDNKDRWIVTLERERPEPVSRHRLTDPAWISWAFNDLGWLPDTDTLWYTSEETGLVEPLYLVHEGRRAAPAGRRKVRGLECGAEPRRKAPLLPGQPEPSRRVRRLARPGGGRQARAAQPAGGDTYFWLSQDESQLVLLHSSTTRHGELYVQRAQPAQALPEGAEARQITQTHTPEFLAIEWTAPEIVAIPSSHVKEPIYSRVYSPAGFDPPASTRRSSSPMARVTCRTLTPDGPVTSGSSCSTLCSPATATSCSTWTTAPRPATAATGAPPSTGRWAIPRSKTWRTAWPGWCATRPLNPHPRSCCAPPPPPPGLRPRDSPSAGRIWRCASRGRSRPRHGVVRARA